MRLSDEIFRLMPSLTRERFFCSTTPQIADMAIQIASACGEQDAVSDELGRNVARINDSSNEVATGADHTAKACLELSQLASGLRQSMGRFRLA